MNKKTTRYRCPSCGEYIKREDYLVIDEMNGLRHKDCPRRHLTPIKDEGTFTEIAKKYPFFE
ncbi:hypothetical protein LCL95_09885 [Bacillus timonensis]|nr:hypothetical protein [Bacillus timonensis]